MARSIGLISRRNYLLDALTILVGFVGPGTRGRLATTRTGAAQLLNTRLEAQNFVKVVVNGQSATSGGGWRIEAAHVPEGGTLSDASTYALLAIVEAAPNSVRDGAVLTGPQIREAVRAAGSLTGDVRVVAIRAVAGNGTNGTTAPAGTNTVSLQFGA